MTSLRTVLEMHAIWQGYVEDPAAKDFVARKARTIALSEVQGICHKKSDNQPYSQVWTSLGDSIPKLYCIAWPGLGYARKCQFEDFCEKERYDLCSVQWTFAPETIGKRWKRENSPVVKLLPGSHEHLASRNPLVLCQKHGGACTMYELGVPMVQETGQEIGIPCSRERRKEISK
jgi:hypothetical protein